MTYEPDLNPAHLEAERARFAEWVVNLAASCRTNDQFLQLLNASLPPDFLQLTGEGTCRRTFATKLGVALKLQREVGGVDPLTDEEASFRAEPPKETDARRRGSNIAEVIFSTKHPKLTPRLYGALFAFGWVQNHPSVLVVETCRPLTHLLPNERLGVFDEDMGIDRHGHLWVFDSRLTDIKRPPDMRTIEDETSVIEKKIQLANLGISNGRYVFLDRSDHGAERDCPMNPFTRAPKSMGWCIPTPAQDLAFSKTLLAKYNTSRERNDHEL